MDANIEQNSDKISSKEILSLSFELLRDYFKPLTGTFMIAFLASIIVWILSFLLSGSLGILLYSDSFYSFNYLLSGLITFASILPGFFVLFSFIGSGFGMTSEILTGGDYFVELKSSFSYFKKHWSGYSGFAMIFILISILISLIIPDSWYFSGTIVHAVLAFVITSIAELLTISILGFAPVALSQDNSFIKSISISLKIFRKHGWSIIKAVALLILPIEIFSFLYGDVVVLFLQPNIWAEIYFFSWFVLLLGLFFIYLPLLIIHLTILYQQFMKPVKEMENTLGNTKK
ncbi:hypothetical protein [Candidatus Lokiarchaeum ossiferum]|uniref:hypothetical protein n=1 Tax=Candidatus Lokiarchaeum ossiferum TaxID=2951803 RepID=UPI00352DC0EF